MISTTYKIEVIQRFTLKTCPSAFQCRWHKSILYWNIFKVKTLTEGGPGKKCMIKVHPRTWYPFHSRRVWYPMGDKDYQTCPMLLCVLCVYWLTTHTHLLATCNREEVVSTKRIIISIIRIIIIIVQYAHNTCI